MKKSFRKDDVVAQVLRAAGNPEELDKILQSECRRKASKKLATTLLCKEFRFPTAISAEQCTSDELAEFHSTLIGLNETVLDLTCGLAIDAFHFAKVVKHVTCIDINPLVYDAVVHNSQALGLTNISAECCDCVQWLKENINSHYDVVFIDPARRSEDGGRIFSMEQCQPNVIEMLSDIFNITDKLIIKASPMLDITKAINDLKHVSTVHVIGTKSECKELLFELNKNYTGPISIIADTVGQCSVNLTPQGSNLISETYVNEICENDIIAEPWPAVMKCMPRGLLSGNQLHPSTFLWHNPTTEFPGTLYRVTRIEKFSSSHIRKLQKEKIEASVAVRNFPITASQLKEKLKSKESSTCRLMGTMIFPSEYILLFLEPIIEKN